MKRLAFWGLSGLLAAAASFAGSLTYYVLDLQGGSKVYSVDAPVRKGRVLLFHRFPDGVYVSLSASEVAKVSTLEAEPPPAEKLAPGGTLYVGPPLAGPNYEMPPAPPVSYPSETYYDSGYSGYGDYYYGGGYFPPPRPAAARAVEHRAERISDHRAPGHAGIGAAAHRRERISDHFAAAPGTRAAPAVVVCRLRTPPLSRPRSRPPPSSSRRSRG